MNRQHPKQRTGRKEMVLSKASLAGAAPHHVRNTKFRKIAKRVEFAHVISRRVQARTYPGVNLNIATTKHKMLLLYYRLRQSAQNEDNSEERLFVRSFQARCPLRDTSGLPASDFLC